MKSKIVLTLILVLLFGSNLIAQRVSIEKVKEYNLPDGYDCTIVGVVREEIVITCPDTRAFYHSVAGEDLKEVPYQLGRGPGELNRAPFGIGILKNQIVFSDPDLQRLFIYDKRDQSFSVKLIKPDGGLSYIHSTKNDSLIFVRNGLLTSLGNLYNVNTDEFSEDFLLDKPSGNAFLQDGRIEVYDNVLLFGSAHEGYVSVWDLKTHKQVNKYQLFENRNTKQRQAQMNGLSGFIAPASENQIEGVGLYQNQNGEELVFVLIESRVRKYDMDKLYIYSPSKKKFISELKLEAKANLFQISGEFLYVHYEDLDKLVKYKLVVK